MNLHLDGKADSPCITMVEQKVEQKTKLVSQPRISKHAVFVAGSWIYVLFYVVAYLLAYFGPLWLRTWEQFRLTIFDVLIILPSLGAAAVGVVYTRRFSRSTNGYYGWICIALAGLALGSGNSIWAYYELILRIETPFPSWADAAYLVGQLFLIAGIYILFSTLPVVGRMRLMLDSAIAMTSVAALLWYLLIARLWAQSDTALGAKLIGIAYPLSDIVVLYGACVLYCSTRRDSTVRRSVACLVGGIIFISIADSCFTYFSLQNTYQTGMWVDAGWGFGWILIANALRLQLACPSGNTNGAVAHSNEYWFEYQSEYSPEKSTTLWRLLGPYTAASLAIFALAFYDFTDQGKIAISILGWGTSLLVLVALRQVFTILENLQLTQQFATLLEYTRELNDVLDVEHVLSVTARYAQKLTGAHSAASWIMQKEEEVFSSAANIERTPPQSEVPGTEVYVQTGFAPCFAALQALAKTQSQPSSSTRINPHNVCVAAPLLHRGQEVGSIAVARLTKGFSQAEHNVLETIALEAGSAISNALNYRTAVEAADCDSVTGLLNHRAIHDRLRLEWERAQPDELPLSIVMMDLNDFKFFNDTYGHPVGDQVLQTVANVLHASCRPGDALARYGGDEFILLLPDTNAADARRIAQRIRERMRQEGLYRADNTEIVPVELSLGVATFPDDARTRNELMAAADANLYRAKLDKEPICATSDVQRSNRELRTDESYGFLDALVTAVDNKDSYTRRHSEDVTDYALWLADELGLSQDSMRAIRIGGLLHDVGKIGVPDEILRKPGSLTDEEYEVVKRHPGIGALIVSGVPGMRFIEEIVRSHHERWDGRGYPDGLRGENIPLIARVVAVADACSAMTTTRPYRRGLSWDVALAEIEKQSGKQFDPLLAEAFVRAARRHLAEDAMAKAREKAKDDAFSEMNTPL